MDTTITALQALYVAMGGNLSDVQNIVLIPNMINAIATLVSSGATNELPKVTSSDNGNVLTVVSGKWAKAALPSENSNG